MNKAELIATVAEKLNVSKADAGRTIDTVIGTIIEGAKADGECVVAPLGKIVVTDVPEKSGNAMGKAWTKPAHKTIKLRLGKEGKALV